MQFNLIKPENRQINKDFIDQTYQLRHRVFNEELGWSLPHVNGREFDKFDLQAYYFTAIDEGRVIGTWRAMPTLRPFFNLSVFPSLFEGLEEWRPDSMTWDLSRMAIDRDYFNNDRDKYGQICAGLACAIFEFCITHGVTTLLAVQNKHMTSLANEWLGQPSFESGFKDLYNDEIGLFSYTPNLERLYTMRQFFNVPTPSLSTLQQVALSHVPNASAQPTPDHEAV